LRNRRAKHRQRDFDAYQRERLEDRDARALAHWEVSAPASPHRIPPPRHLLVLSTLAALLQQSVHQWQRQQDHLVAQTGQRPETLNMHAHELQHQAESARYGPGHAVQ
jgi:hypothetical protein